MDSFGAGARATYRATVGAMAGDGDLGTRLGRRVAQLRRDAGMSQAVLAERIGTAVQVVSRIERGLAVPSVGRLGELAEALGVELRDVFDFAAPPRRRRPVDAAVERVAALLRGQPVERVELVRRIAREILKRCR